MLFLYFAILIPLLIIYYVQKKRKYEEYWKYIMKIPGPKGKPFFGTFELFPSEPRFQRERKKINDYFPIFKSWFHDCAFINIGSPEDIKLVLSKTAHNRKGVFYNSLQDWLGTGLLTSEGSKWSKRRKILTPAFHFKILQTFVEILNKESAELVENLKLVDEEPFVDLVPYITEYTLYSIAETSLGVPLRKEPKCKEYVEAIENYGKCFNKRLSSPWLCIPLFYKLSSTYRKNKKTIKTLHDFSNHIIQERKKTFIKDASVTGKKLALLDLMLQAEINDEGIREELDTFIFEAHDTTTISLCFTLMLLANEEVIQERIYQEIVSVIGDTKIPAYNELLEFKYMEMCIKESLRLYPSVPVINRITGENIITKSGYTIPKGCNVNIWIYDMHRRSEIWENPEKFDPDRFLPENVSKKHPFAYIPFSAGSRNCIGQKFALLEIKTALCSILRTFKLESVDRPEDIQCKSDMTLRSQNGVRVKLTRRK